MERLRVLPVITKNPRPAAQPQTDLATHSLCVFQRRSPAYQARFFSRNAVERTNSRIKLIFNLRCHQPRGWEAVAQCALFAVIAMLSVSLGGGQDRSSGEAPLQLDLDQPNLSGPGKAGLTGLCFVCLVHPLGKRIYALHQIRALAAQNTPGKVCHIVEFLMCYPLRMRGYETLC